MALSGRTAYLLRVRRQEGYHNELTVSKWNFGWLGLAIAGVIVGLTPRAHAQDRIRQFGTSNDDRAWALAPDASTRKEIELARSAAKRSASAR